MKAIIGLILVVCGVALGLYVGVWVCFIGGIMDVIEAIRATDLIAMDVAIGVAKVVFAGLAGWLSAVFLALPGIAMVKTA